MGEGEHEWMTGPEVARIFSVDPSTAAKWARRWEQTGEITVIRTPGGTAGRGQFRYLAADIYALLDAQRRHPGDGKRGS